MNYAQIRTLDISNGEGIGVSLFVQGCDLNPKCKGCFNSEAWDFNGGKPWTHTTEDDFLKLLDRDYIKRVSILGGEPLADKNIWDVNRLLIEIKIFYPDKQVWLYTGRRFETFYNKFESDTDIYREVLFNTDVLVDGPFIQELADANYPWAGSTNQRVIDVQKSLDEGKVVLWKGDTVEDTSRQLS